MVRQRRDPDWILVLWDIQYNPMAAQDHEVFKEKAHNMSEIEDNLLRLFCYFFPSGYIYIYFLKILF